MYYSVYKNSKIQYSLLYFFFLLAGGEGEQTLYTNFSSDFIFWEFLHLSILKKKFKYHGQF